MAGDTADQSTDPSHDHSSDRHPLVAFSEVDPTAEAVQIRTDQVSIWVDTAHGAYEFRFDTVGDSGRVEQSQLAPPNGDPVPLAGDEVPSGIQATLREETPYEPEQ